MSDEDTQKRGQLIVPESFEKDDMQYAGGECADDESVHRVDVSDSGAGEEQLQDHGYDLGDEPNCMVAFLIVVDLDGTARAFADPEEAGECIPRRPATLQDMARASQEVLEDLRASRIISGTVTTLMQQSMQMAQQVQQQQQAARIGAMVAEGTDPFRGRRR